MKMYGGLIGAAILIAGWVYAERRDPEPMPLMCTAVDGDTIRCGEERIRLNGIDAPEMPGHCRRGRQCVAGDPIASRDHLAELIRRGPMEITRLKRDRYGRTIAQITVDGLDLSCLMFDHAAYKPEWDEGGRTAAACE